MNLRPALAIYALAAALLFSGCAADLSHLKNEELPPSARISGLVAYEQEENMCGPSSLATLLNNVGETEVTPALLAPLLYTPDKEGTFLFDIAREIRLRGYLAFEPDGGLAEVLDEVQRGHPVLVMENRGLSFAPLFHYSVVGGYDLEGEKILLYEGKSEPVWSPLGIFANTFERSGNTSILALPAGELPLSDDSLRILTALNDLAEAGRANEALPGYEAFVTRFPDDWRGHFALANGYYGIGDKERTLHHLTRAADLAPERPEPRNNLALLLHSLGRFDEAIIRANEAVENAQKGKMESAPYEETLREISVKR